MTFDEVMEHHGVKGMRWGVRSATTLSTHSELTKARSAESADRFGVGSVSRINTRLHAGKTFQQAVRREIALNVGKGVLAVGVVVVPLVLGEFGPQAAQAIHNRAETNRGRASIPAIGMKKPLKFAKSRGGVHKTTTMK